MQYTSRVCLSICVHTSYCKYTLLESLCHQCISQLHTTSSWPRTETTCGPTSAIGATAWQQRRQEIVVKMARVHSLCPLWLQQMSTTTTRGQQRLYCERWAAIETVYSILNIYSMHDTWESLSFPFTTAISPVEHMVCWISVQCVYVTNDAHVCFNLSTQFLCCSYTVWSLHNLLIVCTCTDCMCLTQAHPTMSYIPLAIYNSTGAHNEKEHLMPTGISLV